MRDPVVLDVREPFCVAKGAHVVARCLVDDSRGDGPKLTVCVVEWKKAKPAFWRYLTGWLLELAHVERLNDVRYHVLVRDHDAFRQTCGAAGVV